MDGSINLSPGQTVPDVQSPGGPGGVGPGGTFRAANIMGDLLGAGKSVSFFVNRASGPVFVNGLGATSVVNPKIAENESPVPADRVYFRYNFFDNAVSVTGLSGVVVPAPAILGTEALTTSKSYNVNEFTFGGEKTFFNGMASVELRVPFSNTLSNNLNLNYGTINGPPVNAVSVQTGQAIAPSNATGGAQLEAFNVVTDAAQTLGSTSTQFGDMTLIFKGVLLKNEHFLLSGGMAMGLPTGPNTDVSVTDYLGNQDFNNAEIQRLREFHIKDETFTASPFLAFLAVPTERFFTQGFVQVECPLNSSGLSYSVSTPQMVPTLALSNNPLNNGTSLPAGGLGSNTLSSPFTVNTSIREQTLLHVDMGSGYWLIRDPIRG